MPENQEPQYHGAIFWIEVDKIRPNPFQPRHEFDEDKLTALADSIRQYGVLQPLVVTRQESFDEAGNMTVSYELIAGERRWRASQIAGIRQIPALIREDEQSDKLKLEMAIIENLQREDLNPVDRARAFARLVDDFGLKHIDVAKRIGKSREFVSNSIRILALPETMIQALLERKITEGHTRPLLMLTDRPAEQATFFQELLTKKINVRQAEHLARRIAYDRVRKKEYFVPPDIIELEQKLSEQLGTRVRVERNALGGQVLIDFFTNDDLAGILALLAAKRAQAENPEAAAAAEQTALEAEAAAQPVAEEVDDSDLYNINNFTI